MRSRAYFLSLLLVSTHAVGQTPPAPPAAEDAVPSSTMASAPDDGRGGRSLFEEGERHYRAGKYELAAEAFREAYRLLPSAELLYNLAQAERLSGNCEAALGHYLTLASSEAERVPSDLNEKVDAMQRCVAAKRETSTELTAAPSEPLVVPVGPGRAGSVPMQAPLRPMTSSPDLVQAAAYGCAVGSILSAALGAVFLARANADSERLDEVNHVGGQWNDRYASYESSFGRHRTAAVVLFATSAVLAGTSGFAFYVHNIGLRQGGSISGTVRF
jgi:tetratricopeptide (TPR) repeat protein